MGATTAHVNFDAPAILRKWPSRNNQRCTEGTGLDDGKNVANDPNVWSGRALQEVFVDLVVSGLASMYPAFDWSICSGPSWISARLRSD